MKSLKRRICAFSTALHGIELTVLKGRDDQLGMMNSTPRHDDEIRKHNLNANEINKIIKKKSAFRIRFSNLGEL